MAVRKPLVNTGGDIAEIPAGDIVDSQFLESVITAGSVGDASHVPVLTYDAHGRITAVSTAPLSAGRAFGFFTT